MKTRPCADRVILERKGRHEPLEAEPSFPGTRRRKCNPVFPEDLIVDARRGTMQVTILLKNGQKFEFANADVQKKDDGRSAAVYDKSTFRIIAEYKVDQISMYQSSLTEGQLGSVLGVDRGQTNTRRPVSQNHRRENSRPILRSPRKTPSSRAFQSTGRPSIPVIEPPSETEVLQGED